jgi:hypothetical protein
MTAYWTVSIMSDQPGPEVAVMERAPEREAPKA